MTWDEFYTKVTEKFSYTSKWGGKIETRWFGSADYYEVEWRTGGMGGGNCWGGEPSYSVDSDPVPELDLIDEFLEEICPNMSFFQYKKVMRDLVDHDSRIEYEYYGNSTNYGIKRIHYRALFDRLKEVGVF